MVCVAPGEYAVDEAIEVTHDLSIVGWGGSELTWVVGTGSDRVLTADGAELVLEGLLIGLGSSSSNGGCLRFWDSEVSLRDVYVGFCTSTGGAGGGMYATTSTIDAYDTTFAANVASAEYSAGGGAFVVSAGDLRLANVLIYNNAVSAEYWSEGGGFAVVGDSGAYSLDMNNVLVAQNSCETTSSSAWYVGAAGVLVSATPVVMVNTSIVQNEASSSESAPGLGYYQTGSYLEMTNVAVTDNLSSSGGGSGVALYGVVSTLGYNNVYGNSGSQWGGEVTDPTGTDGNLCVAPDYVDATLLDGDELDFRLAETSAMVDAGDPGILDADASRSDIGAYGGPEGSGW